MDIGTGQPFLKHVRGCKRYKYDASILSRHGLFEFFLALAANTEDQLRATRLE